MHACLLNDFDPFAELYTRQHTEICELGASRLVTIQVGVHLNLLVEVGSAVMALESDCEYQDWIQDRKERGRKA